MSAYGKVGRLIETSLDGTSSDRDGHRTLRTLSVTSHTTIFMTTIRLYISYILLLAVGVAGAATATAQPSITLNPEKAITQYRLDRWGIEEGLPMNRVQALVQTTDGYVWLGTQEGLVRFDGFDFHVFDSRNSPLKSNDVSALSGGEDGALWVGTSYDGVARYQNGRFTTYTTAEGLSSDHVHSLLVDSKNRVWIGTQNGLNVLQGGDITPIDDDRVSDKPVRAMYEDADGVVWIGTVEAGLLQYVDDDVLASDINDRLPSQEITAIYGDVSGSMLVGTRMGLAIVERNSVRTITEADGLPSGVVRSLWRDTVGSIWIGTEGGGLTRSIDGRLESFSQESISSVWALLEDREGSLWIGTQRSGLIRLQDGKFTTYTEAEGLGSNSVYSVVEDAHGDMWIGTMGGGVSRIRNGEITTYTTETGFASDYIAGLYASDGGSVWIGALGVGLVQYRNGSFRRYTQSDGLPDDRIYNIYEDSQGVLWMGSYKQGLVRYDGRRFLTYTTEDGLTDNAVTVIEEGPDGYLWFGTFRGGLNLMKDGVVIHTYTTENGLPQNYVTSLYRDGEGVLWIGTQEGGLTRLHEGRLTTITTEDGLFNNSILQILEDEAGRLWMSSNRGLFTMAKSDVHDVMNGDAELVNPVIYDRSDGLNSTEFNGGAQPAGWKDTEGRLWFVSTSGVVSVDPDNMPLNSNPPPVVIERVLATGEPVRMDTSVVLAPGRNKIEIDFVGLSYMANDEVEYEYRLEGVDEDWVDSGTRRQAFYTNLPPGDYTFQVRARNADGVWSQEAATFSFYLEPFFYETLWFFLLMAVALMLGGVALYKLRVRHLKARQRELEEIVDARTRDLREEKEKVEKAKAVIEEQAEQLRELDRLKTQFFSNISHEFRTPLTLNIGPLENALTGLYGPVPDVLKKQLQIMLRNARRLLRLINQLLDLSKLESGRMDLQKKRINVVQFVEGVVFSFTAFTEQNKISLDFESDVDDLPVAFDPEAMEKVFFNLLSNAVKFTPEGGRIEVKVNRMSDGEHIEFRVRDTGSGIPEKDLPYIFDRFRQAEGSSSNVQQGTGIGLALVKELVELHGGSIWVESAVGKGTEYSIIMPIGSDFTEPVVDSDDELGYSISSGPMVEMAVFDFEDDDGDSQRISGDGATQKPVLENGDAPATILVADDNPDIRQYMLSCLNGTYHVQSAKNGAEALEKARELRPDLIISDVVMPKMTGYDLCRAVRADDDLKLTPIILVTSKAAVDDKIEGLEAGANDYLPKPFNAEELFARVGNLLTLRKQQHDLEVLNEVLQDKNGELKEASELKSQLLRIAAHDLKNPLNNIREFASLIQEEIEEGTDVSEMLDLIQSSSNKMLELITQILESEALESGQLEINPEPVDLANVASGLVEQNRRQAQRKGQEILFDVPRADSFIVDGSEEWLAESMENLISNAIKYSPPGKKIWVTLRRSASKIEFEVRDDGPGLSEEDKGMLFQKFQRLSARPTGGESSTGLGLSIVKQIVEMHGGDIRVESEVGHGAAFIMAFAASESTVNA